MTTLDFSRSYLRFRIDPSVQPAITVTQPLPTKVLNVRINVECRTTLTHRQSGESRSYLLGSSCKTELVGAKRNLWMEPNADFCLVMSDDEFLVIKNWAYRELPVAKHPDVVGVPLERQSGDALSAWSEYGTSLQPARGHRLDSVDRIIQAICGKHQLISRTEYDDNDWNVVIEHPVKTINFSEPDEVFQTDTGPILFPDLSPNRLQSCQRLVECFDLAYSAFNSPDWVEFIVNIPTKIVNGISVNHYSKTRRIEPVRNALIELLDEASPPFRHVGERVIRADGAAAVLGNDSAMETNHAVHG